MKLNLKILLCTLVVMVVAVSSAQAAPFIGLSRTISLTLSRSTLNNVDDAMGTWQHEGGQVLYKGEYVGHYAIHRRVTTGGTTSQNTAMLTMTIFFLGGNGNAPENITLQGSHDFSSGEYVGSVSAASKEYLKFQGSYFVGSTATGLLKIIM